MQFLFGFLGIVFLLVGLFCFRSEAGLFACGVVGTLLCGLQCLIVFVAAGFGGTGEVSNVASVTLFICIASVIAYWVLSSLKASRGGPNGEG
jgi:hypothetical protein